MSEATYIKKIRLNNNPGSEGAEDLAGRVLYSELDPSLQAMITDVKVKASDTDLFEGNLSEKLQAGESIEFEIVNQGADEKLRIDSSCSVKVSADDSTPAYLETKLSEGDNIEISTLNPGAEESLEIKGLGRLKVSQTDTMSGFLDDKLAVGGYLQKTITGGEDGEELNLEVQWSRVIHQGLGWVPETITNAAPRTDELLFDVESGKLKPVNNPFANILYRENISQEGSLGTIARIGSESSMTSPDWDAIHGLYFLYVCNRNCWVNIADDGSQGDNDFKPVITGTGLGVSFVKRALFSYSRILEKWLLVSYTKQSWLKRFYFAMLPANEYVEVAAGLPKIGYYRFDVYCTVEELDEADNPVNLDNAQVLTVASINDVVQADISVIHIPVPNSQSKVINCSLQGSGIISIMYQDINYRWLKICATLPNGDTQRITGGYLHLVYCGEVINN